jgi:integrase
MEQRPTQEVRVAPNIYKTVYGWRVYVRRRDPVTGRSKLKPVRFKPDVTLEELQHFRDSVKLESKRIRRAARKAAGEKARSTTPITFREDATTYLALNVVKAMPSYKTRAIELRAWMGIFGDRPRRTITAPQIDEELQALKNAGYSGSTVNKFRTALMSLWTRLDGRSAANPVKDTAMFDEAPLIPRGQSYELLTRILDAIPQDRTRGVKGVKGSRTGESSSRARLEVLAWTGMDPSQLGRMDEQDLSLEEGWYITPPRQKGSKRRRTPRPVIRKPMSKEAKRAFRRFVAIGLLGKTFSTHALRHTWERAIARVEQQLQEEYEDPRFTLPHIRLKDIRHSFGTALYEQTEDLGLVGQMLDHAPGSPMTLRYALKGVPTVLRRHVRSFPRRGRRKPGRALGRP